uniref:hypothetical protein n=1 Tax=Scytothamnus australis TaxID=66621 RepID=UPI002E773652|nr:hypothetical protein V2495_pgp045 [Scytothamnus australis]WAM64764.1 hypothetical protein [Scytothamnus australis]
MTLIPLKKPITYHFIIGSDNFLLVEEPLEEVLRERVQHFGRIESYTNFWVIQSPKFLDSVEFNDFKRKLLEPDPSKNFTAIISTNERFICWLKLRLQNVATGSFLGPTKDIPSPLSSTRALLEPN